MKTKLPSALALSIFAVSLPAAGQQPRVVPPREVPPPQQVTRVITQPRAQAPEEAVAPLPHNVQLSLEGTLFGAIPTDFSVTTGGTSVSSDIELAAAGPLPFIGRFQAVLTPGEPWLVKISISAAVPIKINSSSTEYRDFTLNTAVRIVPGKKVVLWQKGEQKLTLGMEKVEE